MGGKNGGTRSGMSAENEGRKGMGMRVRKDGCGRNEMWIKEEGRKG